MKILVIRFSSIGDVVLTLPVVNWIKSQCHGIEVHLLTKHLNAGIVALNQDIDRIHELEDSISDTIEKLRKEKFDYVLDLHNNHRSRRVRRNLRLPCSVYRKENLHKMLYVLTKHDFMSGKHVVDRYLSAAARIPFGQDDVSRLRIKPTEAPLLTLPLIAKTDARLQKPYVVIACGAQHATKRIPTEKIVSLALAISVPVVLVGDTNDAKRLKVCDAGFGGDVMNLCGMTTLAESAAIIGHAAVVVSSDSAMMHIAAAFRRPVVAVWGATVPSFGFGAYRTEHYDFQVAGLRCRPCSRMGTEKCRKGHFACMQKQDWTAIVQKIEFLAERAKDC